MRSLAVLAALLALTAPARADDARTPVSLGDVLAAIPAAPAMKIGEYNVRAAEAGVYAAEAWPAPTVHILHNTLTAQLTAGGTLPLPIFGTVAAARRKAVAEMEVVRDETAVQIRDLRSRAVQAWIRLARADGEVTSLAIAAQQAAEIEVIAKGRLSAGVGADVDVTVASASRARADVAVRAAEREEDAASAELAGLLGWDPTRHLRASGPLVTGPSGAGESLDALRTRLGMHPERILAMGRLASAEAGIHQARMAYWPLPALEGDILLDDPTNEHDNDVMIGLSFEVPFFTHVGDKVRVAEAQAAAERARIAMTETELNAGLVAAYRTWEAAVERLQAIERDVLPAQERAAALSATAYREGARDLAFALQAERDLAAVRADRNAALADAAAAYAALQLASGIEVGNAQ